MINLLIIITISLWILAIPKIILELSKNINRGIFWFRKNSNINNIEGIKIKSCITCANQKIIVDHDYNIYSTCLLNKYNLNKLEDIKLSNCFDWKKNKNIINIEHITLNNFTPKITLQTFKALNKLRYLKGNYYYYGTKIQIIKNTINGNSYFRLMIHDNTIEIQIDTKFFTYDISTNKFINLSIEEFYLLNKNIKYINFIINNKINKLIYDYI